MSFAKEAWAFVLPLVAIAVALFWFERRDGLVTAVEDVVDPEIGPGPYRRVVTFLSVFDVHVQRCPVAGEVVFSALLRGQKLAAYRADVGDKNERYTNVFLRPNGDRIGVRQLVGLYVPASYEILVKKGDRVRVGETPMARDSSAATPGTR